MAPLKRLIELEKIDIEARKPKQSAVMALFYPSDVFITRFVLILRKDYKGVHARQIGFPGGKVEINDINLQHTALRETHEEVGVLPDTIQVVRPLTEVYIPPSNFKVQPFLGVTSVTPNFIKQDSEVEDILEVDFLELLNDTSVKYEVFSTSYAKNIEIPTFNLGGFRVWGATAMMLSEIKELFKQQLYT